MRPPAVKSGGYTHQNGVFNLGVHKIAYVVIILRGLKKFRETNKLSQSAQPDTKLWNVCKQYSQVVDAFIPNRKSNAGKRYGFVRFIRVYIVDRLVSNLCTLWMGSHHLHANVASFDNMRMVGNEGFNDIDLRYMGGFIKEDFDGSDVEKEGDNNVSMVPDSVKEDVNVQAEEKGNDLDVNNSLDPFELYSLLNKKRNVEEEMDKSNGTMSISFPPGFTPCDETEVECDKKSMGNNEGSGFGNEKGESVSIGSRKSNKIDIKSTGGSLLTVMEELIKVGKTMGYIMEGCIK
nr:ChaC-like family protein [Tanacetum cinerariifolium]